jgi:hypothetical protein
METDASAVFSRIRFPVIVIFLTFASLLASAFFYENNIQLVNCAYFPFCS